VSVEILSAAFISCSFYADHCVRILAKINNPELPEYPYNTV